MHLGRHERKIAQFIRWKKMNKNAHFSMKQLTWKYLSSYFANSQHFLNVSLKQRKQGPLVITKGDLFFLPYLCLIIKFYLFGCTWRSSSMTSSIVITPTTSFDGNSGRGTFSTSKMQNEQPLCRFLKAGTAGIFFFWWSASFWATGVPASCNSCFSLRLRVTAAAPTSLWPDNPN